MTPFVQRWLTLLTLPIFAACAPVTYDTVNLLMMLYPWLFPCATATLPHTWFEFNSV